jgi:hypothetical protein
MDQIGADVRLWIVANHRHGGLIATGLDAENDH